MDGFKIRCGNCGVESDLDDFTRTPINGELPRNRYQCPNCHYAFERRGNGVRILNFPGGEKRIISETIKLVPVDPVL